MAAVLPTTCVSQLLVESRDVTLSPSQLQLQSKNLLCSIVAIVGGCTGRSGGRSSTSKGVGSRGNWQGAAGGRVVALARVVLARKVATLAELCQQLIHGVGVEILVFDLCRSVSKRVASKCRSGRTQRPTLVVFWLTSLEVVKGLIDFLRVKGTPEVSSNGAFSS